MYVDVDDTPLVVRAARIGGDVVFIALSDGTEETLAPTTLTIDEQGVMRCRVRQGRLEARIANSAAAVLGDLIEDPPAGRSVHHPRGTEVSGRSPVGGGRGMHVIAPRRGGGAGRR